MKDSPCYNCDLRRIGCHSVCKAYKEYEEWRQTIRDKKAKNMPVWNWLGDVSTKAIKAARKKGRKRW